MASEITETSKDPMVVVASMLHKKRGSLSKSLAGRIPEGVFANGALMCYRKVPGLFQCTEESQLSAWFSAAQFGQVPGIDVHWIPFKNGKTGRSEVTSVTDYKNLITKALESGKVQDIYAEVVFANDDFKMVRGTDPSIRHNPVTEGERGDIKGFYMVAFLPGASRPHFDYMGKADVDKIRARSRAGQSGPWVTDYIEMGKKTVLRRGLKTLPRALFSVEFLQNLQTQDEREFGDAIDTTGRTVEVKGIDLAKAKAGDPAAYQGHERAKAPTTLQGKLPEPPPNPDEEPPPNAPEVMDPDYAAELANEKKALKEKLSLLEPDVSDKILADSGIDTPLDECEDLGKITFAIGLCSDRLFPEKSSAKKGKK